MEYIMVVRINSATFVTAVNNYIKNGYTPQGSVSIAINAQTSETTYAQAMIKETV